VFQYSRSFRQQEPPCEGGGKVTVHLKASKQNAIQDCNGMDFARANAGTVKKKTLKSLPLNRGHTQLGSIANCRRGRVQRQIGPKKIPKTLKLWGGHRRASLDFFHREKDRGDGEDRKVEFLKRRTARGVAIARSTSGPGNQTRGFRSGLSICKFFGSWSGEPRSWGIRASRND